MTRRSVPRGVARRDCSSAVIIPFMHTVDRGTGGDPDRAPMSRSRPRARLVVNPLTIPPIYYAAYRIGSWELHHDATLVDPAAAERFSSELSRPAVLASSCVRTDRARNSDHRGVRGDRLPRGGVGWRCVVAQQVAPAAAGAKGRVTIAPLMAVSARLSIALGPSLRERSQLTTDIDVWRGFENDEVVALALVQPRTRRLRHSARRPTLRCRRSPVAEAAPPPRRRQPRSRNTAPSASTRRAWTRASLPGTISTNMPTAPGPRTRRSRPTRSNYGMFNVLDDLSQRADARRSSRSRRRTPTARSAMPMPSFMDEAGVEAKGLAPFEPWLNEVRGAQVEDGSRERSTREAEQARNRHPVRHVRRPGPQGVRPDMR